MYNIYKWENTLITDILFNNMIWYDMIWYDIIWYDMIWKYQVKHFYFYILCIVYIIKMKRMISTSF